MSYIDRQLHADEKIIYRGQFHWHEYAIAWLALILLCIFIIGIFMFIAKMIHLRTTDFAITSQRIIIKSGLFTASVEQLTFDGVEGATLKQTFFGRLLGYGKVVIEGRGDTNLDLPQMKDPAAFLKALAAARDAADAKAQPVSVVTDEIK